MQALRELYAGLRLTDRVLLAILLLVFIHNLSLDIMEIDAMQYAGMSKEMSQTHEYLQVHEWGSDYLDKPPLLFWISSLSISLFGAHSFAYKLPSFLMLLLGLYSVYRFARVFYSRRIATDALLILASCQAYNQMTNDVRTDGLLTASVALGLWGMAEYIRDGKLRQLLLGSVGVGLAMLAKGPIGLIAIMLPVVGHLMITKQWRKIWNPQWIWLLMVVGLMLAPMLWGLYQQYDLHPEKEVYGLKGPSGILFYFWTQSFGRITGDIYWDNGLPWHFFLGSIWWDFFPWTVFLFAGLYKTLRSWKTTPEYISLLGFGILFVVMSLSRYKLPHYIFVTFPMAAVIASVFYNQMDFKYLKISAQAFSALFLFLLLLSLFWPSLMFPPGSLWFFAVWVLSFILVMWLVTRVPDFGVSRIGLLTVYVSLFLSFVFYPALMPYQDSSALAHRLNREPYKNIDLGTLNDNFHGLDFYTHQKLERIDIPQAENIPSGTLLISRPDKYRALDNTLLQPVDTQLGFKVSTLKLHHLLKSRRALHLDDTLLILQKSSTRHSALD